MLDFFTYVIITLIISININITLLSVILVILSNKEQ